MILAGGKSSRMGRDKTMLKFGEFPTLTHFVFDRMSDIFSDVFVSAKVDKFSPPMPLIKDSGDDFSPMVALKSILLNFKTTSKDNKIFIIPADMPFVSSECIKTLFNSSDKAQICVARDENRVHSLCGFYDTSVLWAADELIEKNQHKILNLFEMVEFQSVEFKDKEQFINLNYISDYEKALQIYKERK